jgi:hypothetical protein
MREPLLILDSRERWRPVPVEALAEAGATVGAGGKVVDVDHLPEAIGRWCSSVARTRWATGRC